MSPQANTAAYSSENQEYNNFYTEDKLDLLVLEHRENGRKLARSLLRRWRVRMNLEEVDSTVDLALCEAAKRFSDKHGASFMTFFFYHLRGLLVRAVSKAVSLNNIIPASSKWPGMDISELAAVGEDAFKNLSPDYTAFGFSEIEGPENLLLRKEKILNCREACSELDELEQEILFRSYKDGESLINIAKSLGYSRCHISRVKKRALENLESILEANKENKNPAKRDVKNIRLSRTSAGERSTKKRRRRRKQGQQTQLSSVRFTKAA